MSRIKLATIGKNYAKHIEEELALLNKRLGLVGTSLHNLISPISMFLDYGRKLTNINPEVLENLATISDNLREFYGEISNKEDSLIEYLNKNKVAINNTISEIQKSLDITKPSLEDVSNFERSSEGWAKAKINYRKKIISQLIGDKFGMENKMNYKKKIYKKSQLSISPKSSPWGEVEYSKEIFPGVWNVSTPGHGGIMIEKDSMPQFTQELKMVSKYGGKFKNFICFEEDVEALAVVLELLEKGKTPEELGYLPSLSKGEIIKSLNHYYPEYIRARGLKDIKIEANYKKKIYSQLLQSFTDQEVDEAWTDYLEGREVDHKFNNADLYVNIYEMDKAFGGPEEGGWWYNIYTSVKSIPVKGLENAVKLQKKIMEKLNNEEDSSKSEYIGSNPLPPENEDITDQIGDIYSTGKHMATIETHPAKDHDNYRPYE